MIIKKIQTNETVKFRVPAEVAGQIRRIEAQCKNLGWKFTLNDEIADLIAKKCKRVYGILCKRSFLISPHPAKEKQ